MTTRAEYLAELIHKDLKGELTETEARILSELAAQDPELAALLASATEGRWLASEIKTYLALPIPEISEDTALGQALAQDSAPELPSSKRTLRPWWYAAASILLFIAGSLYVWRTQDRPQQTTVAGATDIAAGVDAAMLTLPDGRTLRLDSTFSGVLPGTSNATADAGGALVYEGRALPEYHTLTTAYGMQYQVRLADGTIAYLNAGSSIRYPTFFEDSARRVEIQGEVYLSVAKALRPDGSRKPFIVNVAGKQEVEVLGTEFNISAYANEANIKTTLVEGAVRVRRLDQDPSVATSGLSAPAGVALVPGEQSILTQGVLRKTKVDVAPYIGWKEGFFNFEKQPLRVVMRQLERWYDIQVVYKGQVPDVVFRGKVYRSLDLADVLYILQKMGVQFELQGRTLTVTT